jgi:hypothetical protein
MRKAGAGKRIASLIVYYRISSNTARAIRRFIAAARTRRSSITTRLNSLLRRRGEWRG